MTRYWVSIAALLAECCLPNLALGSCIAGGNGAAAFSAPPQESEWLAQLAKVTLVNDPY